MFLESEEIRTELISVMLQPELLPIFSGHKEIPETCGMCTKIEQRNLYSFGKGSARWMGRYFFSY